MKKVILILVCMFCMAMGLFAGGQQDDETNQETQESGVYKKTLDCGCEQCTDLDGMNNGHGVLYISYYNKNCNIHTILSESSQTCGCYEIKYTKDSGYKDESHTCDYHKDETYPSIKVIDIMNGTSDFSDDDTKWYKSATLEITVSDNRVINEPKLKDNNLFCELRNTYNGSTEKKYLYEVKGSGKHTISIEVSDGKLNSSSSLTVRIDEESPTVCFDNLEDNWINRDYALKAIIEENYSGIQSFEINDKSTGSLSTNQTYLVSGEGEHTIKAIAIDKAGNSSNQATTTIKIDKTCPEIESLEVYYIKNNNEITEFAFESVIQDSLVNGKVLSNMKDVTVNGVSIPKTSGNQYTKNFAITDELRGKNITLQLKAIDNAGNISQKSINVFIPADRQINAYSTDSSNVVNLWNMNDSYETVTINRSFSINNIVITEDNFSEFFVDGLREEWRSLQEQNITSSDLKLINGSYCFADDKLGSFGHKDIQYTIKVKVKNPYPLSEDYCEEIYFASLSPSVNHKANMTLLLQGSSSCVPLDFKKPITSKTISNLQLDADGSVRLLFKMEDEDAEPYHVKLMTIPYAEKDGFSIGIPVEGFEADFISEKCQPIVNGHTYIQPNKDGWYEFEAKLYLPFNHSQVYLLEWDEGFEPQNYTSCKTEMIPLKAEPVDLGGFKLSVDENALYNANGITATVHQEFELSINKPNQSDITDISWDFGEASTSVSAKKLLSSNGYSVAYGQNEARSGNTSKYTLTLTVMHKNGLKRPVSLPVFIEDTRHGKLLGNEIWRGQHILLGEVIVPDGYALTLEENQINPDNETEILCYGSSRQNEKGKLTIEKGASVIISTELSFQEAKNTQSQGFVAVEDSDIKLMWAGIEVSGSLSSDGNSKVTLIGAQRGLILCEGGTINLSNISITDCLCGIHIIGGKTGAKLTLANGTIANNSEYGVKIETDASGANKLLFNKVVITDNGRDSYMNGKINVINGGE